MDEARLNLTRRFHTAREARDEAESNLSAGSLWVPLVEGMERPALLRAVLVSLQLEDGTALEGLRGRVTCLAPAGCAVVLDDLPPANVLTRLLGGELPPPPPAASTELAPEDAPPLPAGLQDAGWQPIATASPGLPPMPPAAPPEEPARVPEIPVAEPAPLAVDASMLPPEIPDAEPAPFTVDPSVLPGAIPDAEPAPFAVEAPAPPPEESADFPMMRAPVPAVSAEAGMWGEEGNLDLDVKALRVEEPSEPAEPPLPAFTVRFADGTALETAWKGELGASRVLVTSPDPPALDARVEVTLLLPEVGALVLEGTVVHRAGTGAGVRLDIDSTTRALIESALPSNNLPPVMEPESAPPPPPPPDPVPRSSRPSIELVKDAAGKSRLVVSFDSLADFRREYESNIRRGGVMVPTSERPPVRSVLEIVFSLLGGKREVRLNGEVVLHGPSGIGVQLAEIPQTTRVEIESLIAAAGSGSDAPAPAPAAPAAASIIAPPPPAARPAPPPSSFTAARPAPRAPTAVPAGSRISGDLVEVMREAEVEGEAGVTGIGAKASWLKVLAHLQAARSSGVLKAIRKAETKYYVVHQGRVLDSKGEPARDDESMLRVVRKNNLAKPGVLRILDRALDKATDELKALEGANIWSAAEIDRARRWQILERCAEVFAWEKGQFEFDPDGDGNWARPTVGVPFGHVILHGVGSYLRASGEDLARILRGGMDRSLRIVSDTGFEPARVGMSDKDLQFWADIDGKKTLRQLLATSPLAQSRAHRLVFALCRLGVLQFDRSSAAARTKDADRVDMLKTRLNDLKGRDPFGRLGISWMSGMAQVQAGWEAMRRELETDARSPGTSDVAKEILSLGEAAWRQLMDERTRRLQRLKVIEDPSRIEAAADMLADRAELLRLQGDKPGAEAALQMALDMAPGNQTFLAQLSKVRAS